jgi:SAM-dependent methyltransferase
MCVNESIAAEDTSGLRAVFSLAWAYRLAQRAIGAERFRNAFVGEILRPTREDRIIDIGCGTADILDHLPELDYIGFDHSPRYIADARSRFRGRGRFETAAADGFVPPATDRTIAMAIGVLHHLDDQSVGEVLRLAQDSLEPGGRFVSIDPTIVDGQHPIARFIASKDRGQNVRSPQQIADLVSRHLSNVSVSIRHDLLRVPYSHVIVEATGSSARRSG